MYSFDIAKKYLFGRDKSSAINGIAIVSFIAISLVAFGLIVVLSVFNGYVDIINRVNADIDPPILIKLKSNKNFPCDTAALDNLRKQKGIVLEPILYSKGIININGDNKMVFIQGVGPKYHEYIVTKSDRNTYDSEKSNFETIPLIIGKAVSIECKNNFDNISLTIPKRVGLINPLAPSSNFISKYVDVQYVLEQKREDIDNTIFMDISHLSDMLSYKDNESSAIIILGDKSITKEFANKYLPEDFVAMDKSDQHPELNFIIKTEKLMTFFIMLFILLLAVFNVSGCILMMIIEKKNDCSIMKAIGITIGKQKQIFRISGIIISLGGIIVGMVIGIVFVLLQSKYGFIYSGSEFNRQPIPVELRISDILYILLLSCIVSYLLIIYSTRYLKRICHYK